MTAPARRGPGRDPRIAYFRGVLESLLESLDATVRLTRWRLDGGEAPPEPLQKSAAQLLDRLGTANRIAAGRFVGSASVVANSDAIRQAIHDLDAAFVTYRRQLESSAGPDQAAMALDAEIGRVKLGAHDWDS
jgi:hypothetical protein